MNTSNKLLLGLLATVLLFITVMVSLAKYHSTGQTSKVEQQTEVPAAPAAPEPAAPAEAPQQKQ